MGARVLFAGLLAIATVVIAGPAWAKTDLAEANITGPGLKGGLRIEGSDTEGLWESGIDVAGGLDDGRADSVEELGLTAADLGPRYLVTYRFDLSDALIRQDLYPYANGGPVTYTPRGQELTAQRDSEVRGCSVEYLCMPITAGWYKSSHPCRLCGVTPLPPEKAALHFFHYLVEQGLPETNPVASAAIRDPYAPGAQAAPWVTIALVLVGSFALSFAAPVVRRRVFAGTGST